MKPTLIQIETLYWIARLESFHAAAAHLNVTQPTVSLRIRELERALEIRLFEPSGRGMSLTMEAASLMPWVERMMAHMRELSIKHSHFDPLGGRLRLGAPDSIGMICMSTIVKALKEQFPTLEIVLSIDKSTVLNQLLNERKLDVAFLVDPKLEAHVRTERLGSVELRWVASSRLRLRRRHLRPQDLVDREIITNPAPSALMSSVLNWFTSVGLAPARIWTCDNLLVIVRLIADGVGVSLLPTAILSGQREAGTIQVYRPQPEITPPQMFAAYQVDKAGPGVRAALEIGRTTITRAHFVTPV